MTRALLGCVAVAGLACVLVPSSLAAPPKSETASSGNVRATLVYSVPRTPFGDYDLRLAIDRAGAREHDARVLPRGKGLGVSPLALPGGRALAVRDLDGDREPEVLLTLSSGGAHCCVWLLIYRWHASRGAYTTVSRDLGDAGYRLADLDGDRRTEFVSADARFAYAFASFGGSGFPLQIWTYDQGVLTDTTRAYPALVAKDAAKHWRSYRAGLGGGRGTVRGYLAAWAADQCLLGRGEAAFAKLRRLSHTFSKRDDVEFSGSASRYLRELRSFLRKTGYLP